MKQIEAALAEAEPQTDSERNGLPLLAERANRELARWGHDGHDGHELTLERVDRGPGSGALRCLFWCESCHVSQLLVLHEPGVR